MSLPLSGSGLYSVKVSIGNNTSVRDIRGSGALSACKSVYHVHSCALGDQKRVSDTLGLEL